jgi:predicted pyridoxine 5'-phosphate oxidase superfamily flavin-nucleotide-binding protein
LGFVHPLYRALIEASPFVVLATSGPGGLDVSPRGDAPGFVVVEDEKTLLLPDLRGNNRIVFCATAAAYRRWRTGLSRANFMAINRYPTSLERA